MAAVSRVSIELHTAREDLAGQATDEPLERLNQEVRAVLNWLVRVTVARTGFSLALQ